MRRPHDHKLSTLLCGQRSKENSYSAVNSGVVTSKEPTITTYSWEGGRKRRPLTLFSASFPQPVQGVSPAALNALAAVPGRPSLRTPGFRARITLDIPTRSKKRTPLLILLTESSKTGSLCILTASTILLK